MIFFSSKEYTFRLMSLKIVFVYNANTDPLSAVVDYAHKVFKPSTYKCELCALTHHNFGQRNAWKNFKKETNFDLSFWYIRQFEEAHIERYEYPVVLKMVGNKFVLLLDKTEITHFKDVDELIERLEFFTRE